MDDRAVGLGICVASTALFAYYTIWVLVTPFVEPGHAVRRARTRTPRAGAHPLSLIHI